MKTLVSLAVVACGGLFPEGRAAGAQTWRQTSAPEANWIAVACSSDGSKLVAAVSGGLVYTSANSGETWAGTSAPTNDWISVASSADGSKQVAVVKDGPIYASTNAGATWRETSAPAMHWSSITTSADGSTLVATVGGIYPDATGGPIFVSRDSGDTWTATSAEIGSWNAVAASADGNKFVAVSQGFRIATSVDAGGAWTTISGGHYPISVASSADGTKLVLTGLDPFHGFPCLGGAIFTSTNSGATWEQRPAGTLGHGSLASSADGTRLVAAGGDSIRCTGGAIMTSTNAGATWAETDAPTTNWSSVASSADGSKLVAVVNGGGIWTWQATPTRVLFAAPLDHWQGRNLPSSSSNDLAAVTYGNGQFVTVGYERVSHRDAILTSPDGVMWADHNSGNTNELKAVAWGNGTFVALGRRPTSDGVPEAATIITSKDGMAWTEPLSFPGATLVAAAYGSGVFVAVGSHDDSTGLILTSSNGTSWASQTLPTSSLRLLAHGNGLFVTMGNGLVLTSEDGTTWTERESPPGEWALAYGGGLFVVISGEANFPGKLIYVSPDGEHWTNPGFLGGVDWRGPGFAYGNGTFALLATSGSAIIWLDANVMPAGQHGFQNAKLRGVCYGRGTFLAVGDGGVILQSDPLPTARLSGGPPSAQGFPLTIRGEAGLTYRLQAASELPSTHWTDLLTFTNTSPATTFVDTGATNFDRRFYRVTSP